MAVSSDDSEGTNRKAAGPREAAREARESLYREHVLSTAEAVFAEQGFEAAKVQDISRQAGLSMGSIYGLFAGKEQIFAAILERRREQILALAGEALAPGLAPATELDALARAYIAFFFAHPNFLRMHLRLGAAWATIARTAASDSHPIIVEILALQTALFRRGVEAGVFVDEDPTYLGALFSGIDQIHLANWVGHGMQEDLASLQENFLRLVRRVFLKSVTG